jgi:AraC-like DNA-binding protein
MATPISQQGIFRRLSTDGIPREMRFAYWRSLHEHLDLSLTDPDAERNFSGDLLECTGSDGVVFGHSASVATAARFGPAMDDLVLLGCVDRGAIRVRHGHDGTIALAPEHGLSLFDYRRRTVATTRGEFAHHYLLMPRLIVIDALGGDPVCGQDAVRNLPSAGLVPFLRSHMQMLARSGEQLSAQEGLAAMRAASDLVTTTLRQLRGTPLDEEQKSASAALFLAACRFMDARCGSNELTAGGIAATLGCSRAHLYRVFAANGTTIGDYLRASRLDKAKALLAGNRSIARIAWDVGYADVASFGRAFKRRFGEAPGEYRAQVRASH